MNPETSQFVTLLTQRYQAFRSLASEVAAGQEACVALDLEGIQNHDMQKVRLCAELRRVELDLSQLQQNPAYQDLFKRLAAAGGDGDVQRISQLWRDSEEARVEAARRNGVYAGFLKRAGSTLNVMMNIMSHCLGVYPPSFEGSASLHTEGGL